MEPIKTYLRLRPLSGDRMSEDHGYIKVLNNTDVMMQPPVATARPRSKEPSKYKFTKVFEQDATQDTVFEQVGLPLLTPVLRQDHYNALLFAYGVSNSGKTFTVLGTEENPGILPHALAVIFKSIEAATGDSDDAAQYRPIGFQDVELCEAPSHHELPEYLMDQSESPWDSSHLEGTHIVDLPSGMDFAVWISIAEIYTEKIYDLLAETSNTASTTTMFMGLGSSTAGTPSSPPSSDLFRRQELRRPTLSLKTDPSSHHKYIHGLREFRVRNQQEAMAVVRAGLKQRQVFSTMLNQSSSRSHCIFTIKIIKVPQAGVSAEDEVRKGRTSVSRISIVDLAGSERVRHTNNTGQRLKEAGNINNSLMVLGQCMEVLRLNQTRHGKTPQLVPFRHSKLTELFQSTLEGGSLERSNCQASMIVNVNPFETSFEENTHVMKFSSVAMNVATLRQAGSRETGNFTRRVAPSKLGSSSSSMSSSSGKTTALGPSQSTPIVKEDESNEEEEDPQVANLLSQIEDLRERWLEAENRCSTIESEVREEMAEEMERRLRKMETFYQTQLHDEASMNETKIGRKMDLLTRTKNSEEATVVQGLQRQIQQLEEVARDRQLEVERAMHALSQAEQSCQEQARAIEALEKQISQWNLWLQAAPCATTRVSGTPPPLPLPKAAIQQDGNFGQHGSPEAAPRKESLPSLPTAQEPLVLPMDVVPPEATMEQASPVLPKDLGPAAVSMDDLAVTSEEEQVLCDPMDLADQPSGEDQKRRDQLEEDQASMLAEVESNQWQQQPHQPKKEEEGPTGEAPEDNSASQHSSIPCMPDTMDNVMSPNRCSSAADLSDATANSIPVSVDDSFVEAPEETSDASITLESERLAKTTETREEEHENAGEIVEADNNDVDEVVGEEDEVMPALPDSSTAESIEEYATALPPPSPTAESMEDDYAPTKSPHSPLAETMEDDSALALSPNSPLAENMEDDHPSALSPSFSTAEQMEESGEPARTHPRSPTPPEDVGPVSKKIRLDGGVPMNTQWHNAEEMEYSAADSDGDNDYGERYFDNSSDSEGNDNGECYFDNGENDTPGDGPELSDIDADQQHPRADSADLSQDAGATHGRPLCTGLEEEEGDGERHDKEHEDQEDQVAMKEVTAHNQVQLSPGKTSTNLTPSQNGLPNMDSNLPSTFNERSFSPREPAPQGSGVFDSLPDHVEPGNDHDMDVGEEQEIIQGEVEEEEVDVRAETVMVKTERVSPRKAPWQSSLAKEVIEILSSRESTPEAHGSSHETVPLPSSMFSQTIDEREESSELEDFDIFSQDRNSFLLHDIPESERRQSLSTGPLYPKLPSLTPEPEPQNHPEQQRRRTRASSGFGKTEDTRRSSRSASPSRRKSARTIGSSRTWPPASNGIHDSIARQTETMDDVAGERALSDSEGRERFRRWSKQSGKGETEFRRRSAVRHSSNRPLRPTSQDDGHIQDDNDVHSSFSPQNRLSSPLSVSPPPPRALSPSSAVSPSPKGRELSQEQQQSFQHELLLEEEQWHWDYDEIQPPSPDRRISSNSFAIASMMDRFDRRESTCSSASDTPSRPSEEAASRVEVDTGEKGGANGVGKAASEELSSSTLPPPTPAPSSTATAVVVPDVAGKKRRRVLRSKTVVMAAEISEHVDEATPPEPTGSRGQRRSGRNRYPTSRKPIR
ncbi:hypothetical protein BGZ73_000250 [Actinomortierella ambigua]|nr:hypothetical protein BGZ73_000250 [Actinomortierella ambigua]